MSTAASAEVHTQPAATRFDEHYYRRFYGDAGSRVTSQAEVTRLVRFVAGYLAYLQLPVRRVLDAGCGLGWWRAPLGRRYPKMVYTGIEVSEYLCRAHGWEQASVVDYRAEPPFDLVVCQGVLQYLDDGEAAAAIDNLGRLCRGALYLEALTRADWRSSVDRERTDGSMRLRSGRWYRRRLGRHFLNAGGGLFVHRDASVVLFELEHLS